MTVEPSPAATPRPARKKWRIVIAIVVLALVVWAILVLTGGGGLFDYDTF